MAVRYTAEQWSAISPVEQHVLVSAGAGTGKTQTVIGRILYLLGVEINGMRYETPVSLNGIAAITFTNAAAQDLKTKLRSALREHGRYDDSYEVDTARIGTIHAFCGEVLREFALWRRGDPFQSIVDEGTANSIQAQAVRDILITAVSEDDVAGLADLLGAWSLGRVERFVMRLLDDLDLLNHLDTDGLPPMECTVVQLAKRAKALLDSRLRRQGAIDFDRVVLYTRDMLKTDSAVLESLRLKLHTLIIDEFQDVDPVQKEIAYLLGDPLGVEEKTTHLLLVGDPKQSIYSFRRADVSVWQDVSDDFERTRGATVVSTHQSFRAPSALLGFVDATVGKLLAEPIGAMKTTTEVEYAPLEGRVGGKNDSSPVVELLLIPSRDDRKSYPADQARLIEARAIARCAERLMRDEKYAAGDIAVILPGWRRAEAYVDRLEALDIPAYQLKSAGFYERREILDLIVALRAIRDPADDTALFGFLRSPFVTLRDDTLLEISLQAQRPYWSALDNVRVAEQELLDGAVRLLTRLSRLRDRVPVDELLEDLLFETGYLAYLKLLGDAGEAAVANVERFVRQARASGRSVSDTLAMTDEARERGADEGEITIMPRKNAVTVTSVHSAKGLEWKAVFWAGLLSPATYSQTDDLLIGRNRIALKDPEIDKADQQPALWQELRAELEFEDLAERKRVWYVAATRAREMLIVSGLPVTGKDARTKRSIADYLWPYLGDVSFITGSKFGYVSAAGRSFAGVVSVCAVEPEASSDSEAVGADLFGPQREAEVIIRAHGPLDEIAVPRARPRHSATEFLAFSRCPARHWFKYIAGVREPDVKGGNDAALIDAVKRGLIVHDVLERIEQEEELNLLLDDAIRRRDPDAPPAESAQGTFYRTHLRTEITAVLEHPRYRELAALSTARRELRFLDMSRPPERFEGSFDLIAAQEGGQGVERVEGVLTVLDVKTTQCSKEEAHRRMTSYRPQGDVYVSVAESISGRQVEQFVLHFSHSSAHVTRKITDPVRGHIENYLESTVERIVDGDRSLTEFPDDCRFCGYLRVGLCPGAGAVPESGIPQEPAEPDGQLGLW